MVSIIITTIKAFATRASTIIFIGIMEAGIIPTDLTLGASTTQSATHGLMVAGDGTQVGDGTLAGGGDLNGEATAGAVAGILTTLIGRDITKAFLTAVMILDSDETEYTLA